VLGNITVFELQQQFELIDLELSLVDLEHYLTIVMHTDLITESHGDNSPNTSW